MCTMWTSVFRVDSLINTHNIHRKICSICPPYSIVRYNPKNNLRITLYKDFKVRNVENTDYQLLNGGVRNIQKKRRVVECFQTSNIYAMDRKGVSDNYEWNSTSS